MRLKIKIDLNQLFISIRVSSFALMDPAKEFGDY